MKAEAGASKGCAISGGNVDYSDDVHDEHVAEFDKVFEELIPAILKMKRETSQIIGKLYPAMVRLVPFAKDGGFSEEREYRVVVSVMDMRSTKATSDPARAVEFRESACVLVPYINIFSAKKSLPLERIIIGPRANSNRRRLGIEHLLKSLGLTVEVNLSEIPYI